MKKTVRKNSVHFMEAMARTSIVSAILAIVLGVYAALLHGNCFFTTSSNFVHLSEAAPMLFTIILACIFVSAISMLLLYCMARLATKRHH